LKKSQGALWVTLLEKAYTLYALNGDYENLDKGGQAQNPLRMFIGQPAESKKIAFSNQNDVNRITKNFFTVSFTDIEQKALQQAPSDDAFKWSGDELKTWKDIVRENALDQKWIALVLEKNNDPLHVLRDKDFEKLMELVPEDTLQKANIKNKILNWVKSQHLLPGKRGSGNYTTVQRNIYKQIEAHIDADMFVCASTHEHIASKVVSKKKHTGEEKSKGLVGKHAFSILRYEDKLRRPGVVMRNPWGDHGRDYDRKIEGDETVLIPKKTESGEFWVDLSDLTKRFDAIQMCGCFITIADGNADTATINQFPCYLIAKDGLFFSSNTNKLIPITKSQAIIDNLRTEVMKEYLPGEYRRLKISEQELIRLDTGHTALKGDLEYCVLRKDSALHTFPPTLGYTLATDGLYKINEIGKRITEKDRIVSDPDSLKRLWKEIGRKGGETYNNTIPYAAKSDVATALKEELPNRLSFNEASPNDYKQYKSIMIRYDISSEAINNFKKISYSFPLICHMFNNELKEMQQIGLIKIRNLLKLELEKNTSDFLQRKEKALYEKYKEEASVTLLESKVENRPATPVMSEEEKPELKREGAVVHSGRKKSVNEDNINEITERVAAMHVSEVNEVNEITKRVAAIGLSDPAATHRKRSIDANNIEKNLSIIDANTELFKKLIDDFSVHDPYVISRALQIQIKSLNEIKPYIVPEERFVNLIKNLEDGVYKRFLINRDLSANNIMLSIKLYQNVCDMIETYKPIMMKTPEHPKIPTAHSSLFSSSDHESKKTNKDVAMEILNNGKFLISNRDPSRCYVHYRDQETRDRYFALLKTLGYEDSIEIVLGKEHENDIRIKGKISMQKSSSEKAKIVIEDAVQPKLELK
jgi:hypothetical protein